MAGGRDHVQCRELDRCAARSGDAAELGPPLLPVRELHAQRHRSGVGVQHVVEDRSPMRSVGLLCKPSFATYVDVIMATRSCVPRIPVGL